MYAQPPRTTATARRGFTLVELLMVIVIIGILVSLISVAASYAIEAARRARIQVEINQLAQSIETYKNQAGEYPPCLGINNTPNDQLRQTLLMAHFRKAFPRFTTVPGTTDRLNYGQLQNWIVSNCHAVNPAGAVVALRLDSIDQAEALVLWLGGLPRLQQAAGHTSLLYGFSANPQNPFQPTGARKAIAFDFDESRLTDYDGDGWLEYTPPITVRNTAGMAPYVYFDAMSYTTNVQRLLTYPRYGGVGPSADTPGTLAMPILQSSDWGRALPYASGPSQMHNPQTFQIICAGKDGQYGGNALDDQQIDSSFLRQRAWSGGIPVLSTVEGGPVQLLPGDHDNMTNFLDGTVEDNVD